MYIQAAPGGEILFPRLRNSRDLELAGPDIIHGPVDFLLNFGWDLACELRIQTSAPMPPAMPTA